MKLELGKVLGVKIPKVRRSRVKRVEKHRFKDALGNPVVPGVMPFNAEYWVDTSSNEFGIAPWGRLPNTVNGWLGPRKGDEIAFEV